MQLLELEEVDPEERKVFGGKACQRVRVDGDRGIVALAEDDGA